MKVCVVSSVGGHLREVLQLLPVLAPYEVFYVLNDETSVRLAGRVYRIAHAERDWRVAWNLAQAARILWRERPDVVLSTGAGPAVPVALIAKGLGARVVFIETFGSVRRPSLTGRIMYRLADHFYYQWPALRAYFPHGRFAGPIF